MENYSIDDEVGGRVDSDERVVYLERMTPEHGSRRFQGQCKSRHTANDENDDDNEDSLITIRLVARPSLWLSGMLVYM